LEALNVVENRPAEQDAHDESPPTVARVPGPQISQEIGLSLEEYEPNEQLLQALIPRVVPYFPPGHESQLDVFPNFEYLPLGHNLH
jgi:hypothetical protein